jgi:hypothetical protein
MSSTTTSRIPRPALGTWPFEVSAASLQASSLAALADLFALVAGKADDIPN